MEFAIISIILLLMNFLLCYLVFREHRDKEFLIHFTKEQTDEIIKLESELSKLRGL